MRRGVLSSYRHIDHASDPKTGVTNGRDGIRRQRGIYSRGRLFSKFVKSFAQTAQIFERRIWPIAAPRCCGLGHGLRRAPPCRLPAILHRLIGEDRFNLRPPRDCPLRRIVRAMTGASPRSRSTPSMVTSRPGKGEPTICRIVPRIELELDVGRGVSHRYPARSKPSRKIAAMPIVQSLNHAAPPPPSARTFEQHFPTYQDEIRRPSCLVFGEAPPAALDAVRLREQWCPWPDSNQHALRRSILRSNKSGKTIFARLRYGKISPYFTSSYQALSLSGLSSTTPDF